MKRYILLLTSVLSLFVVSCKKDTKVPLQGNVTISSQLMGSGPYYTEGFSFLSGSIHRFPGQQVDIMVIAMKPAGDVTASFFTSQDYTTGTFNNTYYSSDMATAENMFNNYSEVIATDFQALSDTIKEGQIITFKSGDNKFAKILVRTCNVVSQGNDQYAEVYISWVFQPSGSSKF